MQSGGHKRVVSSCMPCYTKKQKCNRQYPCNNCSRRRRPESCIYKPLGLSLSAQSEDTSTRGAQPTIDRHPQQQITEDEAGFGGSSSSTTLGQRTDSSLASVFGYVQYSGSNSMAIASKFGLAGDESIISMQRDVPSEILGEVEVLTNQIPEREILDVMIQNYVEEVDWMEQIIFIPWFLDHYQYWWTLDRPTRVFDVEFAVLFLRMCAYSLQLLPSPSYANERLRNILSADILDGYNDTAEKLAAICTRIEPRGSLIRIQHLSILGLQRQCQGRNDAFWEAISDAIRIAYQIGLHRGRSAWVHGMEDFDKEIRCRVLCNLYIWDSQLSQHLDTPPVLNCALTPDHLPHMHLFSQVSGSDAADSFSSRTLLALLTHFWRDLNRRQSPRYDPVVAEENYLKFCTDFLTILPPAFDLFPNNYSNDEVNERSPRLPLQRQILHIALFDSVCHNFQPVLLLEPTYTSSLPADKQDLVSSQKKLLAAASLKVLECCSRLHDMLSGSRPRLPAVIMPTFEAAVGLIGPMMDVQFLVSADGDTRSFRNSGIDLLQGESNHLTRDRCFEAMKDGLALLKTLGEVSNMARVQAETLTQLMAKLPTDQGHRRVGVEL